MNKIHGFTLVELVITMALIAILATIALPSFREMLSNNRLLSTGNEFVATFNRARSEAVKRSRSVSITACRPGCGASGTPDWSNGWQTTISGEVLAVHDALASNITATAHGTTAFATTYSYSSQGRLEIDVTNEIMLCDDSRTGETGRLITLEPIGHVSVTSISCA